MDGDGIVAGTAMIAAGDCTTMAEVRAGVDATDRELVILLARRFAFMTAAARRSSAMPSLPRVPPGCPKVSRGKSGKHWSRRRSRLNSRNSTRKVERRDGASDGTRTRDLRRDRPAL
jgi:hypothetical protein